MEWKNTDPRFDINKRANIIILRPGSFPNVSKAGVDTKEGWWIFTDFPEYKLLNVDDEWNQDWCWIFAPERK